MFLCRAILAFLFAFSIRLEAAPLLFEENRGQAARDALFRAVRAETVYEFLPRGMRIRSGRESVSLEFVRAAKAEIQGRRRQGDAHYLLGDDPSEWLRDVPRFERLSYSGVYPGIDAEFYATGNSIEFDLALAPRARLDVVRMAIPGHRSVKIEGGNAVIRTAHASLTLKKPVAYQLVRGHRTVVPVRYRLIANRFLGLEARYDAATTLVVDPVLVYTSYFGSLDKTGESARYAGRDRESNIVLAGDTDALDFHGGAVRPVVNGQAADGFVTKLSPDGSRVLWTTFIGGKGSDHITAAMTPTGDIVVGGSTNSPDFPLVRALQPYAGSRDIVAARLSGDGRELTFSTYIGGRNDDSATFAIDGQGNAVFVGTTYSPDFPTKNAMFASMKGGTDALVMKLSPENDILFSTFFGSDRSLDGADLVAVAPDGSVYLSGGIDESISGLPLVNPYQSALGGYVDSYLAHLSADGQQILFCTLFGGSSHDRIRSGAADNAGVTFTVSTEGGGMPLRNAWQGEKKGSSDAYLARLSADGRTLEWATWFGGTGSEGAVAIALDMSGNTIFGGWTTSADFPLLAPVQSTHRGGADGFITIVDRDGHPLFSSYVGGTGNDWIGQVVVENDGKIVALGPTQSTDIEVLNGLPLERQGYTDTLIVMLAEERRGDVQGIVPVVGSLAGANGSFFRTTVQLHNPTADPIEGNLVFHPQGASASVSDRSLVFRLGSRETLAYADLLPAMGTTGIGSLDVVGAPDQSPLVVARIFNDGGDNGTSGMTESQIAPNHAVHGGQRAILLAPADPVRSRFSVGVRTMSAGATFDVSLFHADGTSGPTQRRVLPPGYFVQGPTEVVLGTAWIANDAIEFAMVEGSAILYGATTDNGTQDPSMQLATLPPADAFTSVVPVIGSLQGANSSFFRTAVQLHNASNQPISGKFIFHAAGAPGSDADPSLAYTLAPHETRSWADLLPAMALSGIGSLDVVPSTGHAPVISARIFNNAGEAGTTGMTESLVSRSEALRTGDRAVLIAPPSRAETRLNIGVRSLENGARFRVTLRSGAGITLAEMTRTFAPNLFSQTSADSFLGMAVADGDSLEFTMEAGEAIIYGASTDNRTQDPSLQFATRVPQPVSRSGY